MDTTTDYRSLHLKKFFEWQEICGKQRAQIEELEKKLEIAVRAINSAAEYLVCMDDLSDLNNGKCNEQMALEELNKVLEKIKEVKG